MGTKMRHPRRLARITPSTRLQSATMLLSVKINEIRYNKTKLAEYATNN
jgi:hypothetical protein